MLEDRLLPCVCGSASLTYYQATDFRDRLYAVTCLDCQAVGQFKLSTAKAALAWNHDKMAIAPTLTQEPANG